MSLKTSFRKSTYCNPGIVILCQQGFDTVTRGFTRGPISNTQGAAKNRLQEPCGQGRSRSLSIGRPPPWTLAETATAVSNHEADWEMASCPANPVPTCPPDSIPDWDWGQLSLLLLLNYSGSMTWHGSPDRPLQPCATCHACSTSRKSRLSSYDASLKPLRATRSCTK